MAYSAPNMVTLRDAERAETHWYISIAPYNPIWAGKVNGSFARGDRNIGYTDGSDIGWWDWTDIEPGMPVYVTTSTGTYRTRLKTMGAGEAIGTMIVAENSIAWEDDAILTITFDYPLFPVMPRMTQDTKVFYKDYDVAYVDQNESPPPVAFMGPDWAGFLIGGPPATATAILDGSESYAIATGATIVSYHWDVTPFNGVSPVIANPNAATTTITFYTPVVHWVKLTVTDSNGKTAYVRACFFVHDATNPPLVVSEATTNNAWASGDLSLSFDVAGEALSLTTAPDEARLLLWSDDYLDDVLSYQGGFTGRQMNKFQGYLQQNSVNRTPGNSTLSFSACGALQILDRITMASMALENKGATVPTSWIIYGSSGITIRQALHHLWHWHSTIMEVQPVLLPDNTLRQQRCEIMAGTLLQMANVIAFDQGIKAKVCCNEQGVIHVERDAQLFPAEYGAGFVITDADWAGDAVIERAPIPQTCLATVGGAAWDGTTGTILMSQAPGNLYLDRGTNVTEVKGQVLETQALTDTLAGRILAQDNNPTPSVQLELSPAAAHSLAFQVVPQQWHNWTVTPADTQGVIDWSSGWPLVVREVSATYSAGVAKKTVRFEPSAAGEDGIPGTYPTPDDIPSDADDTPDVPAPYWPPTPPTPVPITGTCAVGALSIHGAYWTADGGATWTQRNTGLPVISASRKIYQVMLKRGWQTLQGTTDAEQCILVACGDGFVYVSYDAGKTWTNRTPSVIPNSFADAIPPTGATVCYIQADCPNLANNTFYVLVGQKDGTGTNWLQRGWLGVTTDLGLTWSFTALPTRAGMTDGWEWPIAVEWAWMYPANSHDATAGVDNAGFLPEMCWSLESGLPAPWSAIVPLTDPPCDPDANCLVVKCPQDHFAAPPTANYKNGIVVWLKYGVNFTAGSYDLKYGVKITNGVWPYRNECGIEVGKVLHTTEVVKIWLNSADPYDAWYEEWYRALHGGPAHPIHLLGGGAGVVNNEWVTVQFDGFGGGTMKLQHLGVYYGPRAYTGYPFPIGMAVDLEDGKHLYVTYHDGVDQIVQQTYQTDGSPNLIVIDALVAKKDVCHASVAQVVAETKRVFPRCVYQPTVTNWGHICYLFGTDDMAQGLVWETLDKGATWTDRSGTLATTTIGRVAGLLAKGDSAGTLANFYAFTAGDTKVRQETGWVWGAGVTCNYLPRELGVSADTDTGKTLLLLRAAAALEMAEVAVEPYAVYNAKTTGLPVTSAGMSITWIR